MKKQVGTEVQWGYGFIVYYNIIVYYWAWECNYKLNDQPICEQVMTSSIRLDLAICTIVNFEIRMDQVHDRNPILAITFNFVKDNAR